MLRLLTLALVLAALPVMASAAPKRGPLSQVLKGDALARYEAARLEFKASRFQQALAGFTEAHALAGDPRLLWNAAACLRKLERNAEALRTIDRYLAAANELSTEEVDEARRTQLAVRALVAIVRITTSPPGVAISLDGTPLELAGSGGAYVEPGRHAFHFSKPGYVEQLRQEGLKAGETVEWTIELSLIVTAVPPPPEVKVIAEPVAPVGVRWAPWLVVGGGAAAAIVGSVFLITSGADYTRLRQQCGTVCPPQLWAGARDRELAGVVLLSAGAAAIAVGLGWWALGGTPRARVSLGPTQLSLEVHF